MTFHSDRCPTCHRRKTRSHPANAKYWALLHAIADKLKPGGQSFGAEAWHVYFRSRWLGCDDVTMPNGRVATIPRSTAQLDVAEFGEYLDRVEAWAGERDVWLEDLPA